MRNLHDVAAKRPIATQSNEPTLGVIIIEDMRDVREGLSVLINGTAGFRCTGAYRTMEEALARITPEQAGALYRHMFVHINLNTASAEEIMLIPGAGKRMAHEFEEYRPWRSYAQFDKEIGKYVDAKEVARLAQYTFIPLNLNTASEADFMTIPGVGKRMAHEFDEYRPWKTQAQFEKEIGKYVDAKEVARLESYVTLE